MQRSSLSKGEWRKKRITDSTSLPKLHIGLIESCKLCLNLYPCKWLRPSRILVIHLIPIRLCQLWKDLEGCMSFRISFLKILNPSHFRRLTSNLFHSIIVHGKKKFLKKLLNKIGHKLLDSTHTSLTQILLFGNSSFTTNYNTKIINFTIDFILSTVRFDGLLSWTVIFFSISHSSNYE